MDLFFQSLVEWLTVLVERRYGLLAAWIVGLILMVLVVVGVWVAFKLLV